MYRIIGGRGCGKSLQLMLLAKENNGYYVCSNPYSMREKAKAYGINDINFISYEDYIKHNFDHSKKAYIDELERFIQRTIDNNLNGYTISNEE